MANKSSTRLTNEDRNTTVSNALRFLFKARIEQQQDQLTAFSIAHVKNEHPVFAEMKADPDKRKYMRIDSGIPFHAVIRDTPSAERKYLSYIELRAPVNFAYAKEKELRHTGYQRIDGWKDLKGYGECPSGMSSIQLEMDHPIIVAHFSLWDAYFTAQESLRETLYGYTLRERFEEDFPELATNLPPRRSAVRAVAVPVADLRKKLASAGIPLTAQEG